MITVSSCCKLNLALVSLLALGLVSVAVPAMAEDLTVITDPKPLVLPTGHLQDLQGIESRDLANDLGGVGGGAELAANSDDNNFTLSDTPYQGRKIIVFYPTRQESQPESSLKLEPAPVLIGDLTIDQIISSIIGDPDRSTIKLYFR
jgi:hypothetical protein